MKYLSNIQELTFEFDEIESIEEIGYKECTDIEVSNDHSFTLSNGLISHNSAASGLQSTIGREGIGYFACKGLPINAYSQSIQKIVQNEEFKTIMSILELDMSSKDTVSNKSISFDKILIATDADCYAEDTLVKTSNGLTKIKDINIGDKVMSSDGKFHTVTNVCIKNTNEIIVINIKNDVIITSKMQTLLIYRNGEIKEIFAKDLKTTDFLLQRKNS